MAQRSRPLLIVLSACAVWLLLGAAIQFGPGREVVLPGATLDRTLSITGGAGLPDVIVPGDRIVAVDDVDVATPAEFAHAARDARDRPLAVRVALTEREETLLVTAARLDDELPAALRGDFVVVRIGDDIVDGDIGIDELRFWLAQSGGDAVPVTVRYSDQIQGPMRTERPPPSMAASLWFALLLLAAAGVAMLSHNGLNRDERGAAFDMAATVTGGVAAAALTAVLLQPFSPPSLSLWALASLVTWRAASLLLHLWRSRGPGALEPIAILVAVGPAVVALGGTVFVAAGGRSSALDPGWFALVDQLRYAVTGTVVIYQLADLVLHMAPDRRPGSRSWLGTLAGGVIAIVGVGVAIARPDALDAGLVEASLLGLVAAQWLGDLGVSPAAERVVGRAVAGVVGPSSGMLPTLARLEAMTGGREAWFAVGIHGEFVLIGAGDLTGDGAVEARSRIASESLASAFEMLALEGGMYPRHQRVQRGEVLDDDMFVGFSERLGLSAVIPLGVVGDDDALNVFFVVFEGDDDVHEYDLAHLAERLAAHESALLYSELSGIASAELLQHARRLEARPANAPTQATPATASVTRALTPTATHTLPLESVRPATETMTPVPDGRAPTGADAAWARRLGEDLARTYPIDDPETLDEREWRALAFVVDSREPALLIGEPGVGKEFIARAVHARSTAEGARFAALDCSLVPESLVEVELFGDGEEPGLATLVDGGTLLVKSLSRLDPAVTSAIVTRLMRGPARVIFAERYVGPDAGVPRDVNEAIRRAVGDRFVHLTPLRDRGPDVVRYARYFLLRSAMRYDLDVVDFSTAASAQLRTLPLRGNFAELQALVMSAALQADDELVEALPALNAAAASAPQGMLDLDLTPDEQRERDGIIDALERADGNRTHAAEALRMTRGKLLRRMKKFGIE